MSATVRYRPEMLNTGEQRKLSLELDVLQAQLDLLELQKQAIAERAERSAGRRALGIFLVIVGSVLCIVAALVAYAARMGWL